MRRTAIIFGVAVCILPAFALSGTAAADDTHVYSAPAVKELWEQVESLLDRRNATGELRTAVQQVWQIEPDAPVDRRFDVLMRALYLIDDEVRDLVDICFADWTSRSALQHPAISGGGDPFVTANARLFYARHLALLRLYDEAADIFASIDPADVADPAGCLFYQAVCQHALLQSETGLKTLDTLLEHTEDVPERYRNVALLMQDELKNLEEKSLGEVARQMDDVERRLSLGRAGAQVQRVEQRIIATLDEIIEKIEAQQGGGGGGGGSSPQGQPPTGPADTPYLGGQKGPGEVDKKRIGRKDGWGALPEKDEAKAKNLLNQQFPAHYRQAVEEYLKKLARRPAPTP